MQPNNPPSEEFPKAYRPQDHEASVYEQWEQSGLFNPDVGIQTGVTSPDAEVFSMALPPPNVTGVLHMGHAFEHTLQDIVTRYHRLRGHRTLWLPGTDHAAIATQAKVERGLFEQEGKTRHDLGRETFLRRVEEFAARSHDTIVRQMRQMGNSVDWSREAFTLDRPRSAAVVEAFKRLFELGLIYRGQRIVNWDPALQTTVSDDEIEHKEEAAPLYYLRYGPFEIATARPETKFGDKYVVMHPDDPRYAAFRHGQQLELEWINGPVIATVIKDDVIDPSFGTGVMTITPWHDATDFEIAERHNLDKQQIIGADGKLLPVAGEFAGLTIREARGRIIEKLRTKELVSRVDETYRHNVAVNSRGEGLIEPQVMTQWFVGVNNEFAFPHATLDGIPQGSRVTLKMLMRHAIERNLVTIIPDRFVSVYFHWIDHLRDWCISRQIWYGHRIPVFYCGNAPAHGADDPAESQRVVIAQEPPAECPHCGKCRMTQDPDTLDTWFSSALWTFSTLGWPKQEQSPRGRGGVGPEHDLATYHPTSVMMPGYEILFFWVARMILMSTTLLGEVPFRTAYIHGIVRDEQGRKFSKSLGTGVDPLDVAQEFGTDALRMALIAGVGAGNDSNFSMEKVQAYKHFANKLWNISRFVLANLPDGDNGADTTDVPPLHAEQQEYLRELDTVVQSVTDHLDHFRFHRASAELYHYIWHTVADIVIESEKKRLRGENAEEQSAARWILRRILRTCLIILHPFMPFVTETIWSRMQEPTLLLVAPWPRPSSPHPPHP